MPQLLQRAEDIAAELEARVRTLTVANGAETDVGATVFLGKQEIDRSRVPCVSIIEGDDVVKAESRCDYSIGQRYVLIACLPCDIDRPNDAAHKALRDLKRAIFRTDGKADNRWGGKVREVAYMGRDIVPRPAGEALVQAIVEIEVRHVENVASP